MKTSNFETLTRDVMSRKIPGTVKRTILAMLDKKAGDIVVLKIKGINDITDFLVICSGQSSRQNGAIADGIQEQLREEFKLKPFSVEGKREADWILLDYIDFIVHIFSAEMRRKYALEKMWMDAKRYYFSLDQ